MKKLLKFTVFTVLSLLLGNSVLAQKRVVMKPVTETIDFTGYGSGTGNPGVTLSFDSDKHPTINGTVVSERLTVENASTQNGHWGFWSSDAYQVSYFQKGTGQNTEYAYLSGLKAGDIVTIWGEIGNDQGSIPGFFGISSNGELKNTTYFTDANGKTFPDSKEYEISSDGTATLQFDGNYSGLRKIEIQSVERETPHFDYDPGYEEYDMYDEFSENDPKEWELSNVNGNYGIHAAAEPWHTSYTLSDEETGFTLNGHDAKYLVLHDSKITVNNRIAVDSEAGDWRFNFGLRAPDNGKWANFSVCNLKEGDRVVISYTGTAPVFASEAGGTTAPEGPYNGVVAFFDQMNDGTFDEGEDVYIEAGATPLTDWQRGEGNFYIQDYGTFVPDEQDPPQLIYILYTVTEDGHLDFAIAPDTRIVKVKVYSDHQASMVDEYTADEYIARFDITGELQANEHIVPGGLEVQVGSSDASQHAHVVYSAHGPVSVINGVRGYKLPGMTLDADGNLQFQFDLANNIPETGTFYKFMPLEDGKLSLTFQATSMNYYRYDLDGDAVYYGDVSNYGDDDWDVINDRPNEQTVDVSCPYYLVKIDKNGNKTVTTINAIWNGAEYTIPYFDVKADETYYLYGGWNTTNLSYTSPGQGNNTLEYFPFGAGNGGGKKACGVVRLLEVDFNPNKKIYPLAKWVPNGTEAVNTGNSVPNPDSFKPEYFLADLKGYNDKTEITVKKMAGNITKCHPYLVFDDPNDDHHSHLVIDGIEFADGKDKGGTILIKIGKPDVKSNPVYVLTIAYSTDPQFDRNEANAGDDNRGHVWNYSIKSLEGLDWNPEGPNKPRPDAQGVFTNDLTDNSKYAKTKDYGHYFADYFAADISGYSSADEVFGALTPSGEGLLSEEIAAGNSDWMFNYNLQNAGNLYDPVFTNKYDLEADNADLIWDTEGTVIRTSANQSVMFNEFTGNVNTSEIDPDRYVGISQKGQFRIPWLMPNDRVIVWMGVGKGAFNDQVEFNIRGAYDALHNEIDSTDVYKIGGSHWNVETGANAKNKYVGCYHFFAQGHEGGPADMVFKMVSGSMCKIYKIQIYRDDRIITNEVVGDTENDNKFFLWSKAADPNDGAASSVGDAVYWTLKYFGKEQKLADGTNGVNNEIIAQSGHITQDLTTTTFTDAETDESHCAFTYPHALGEIGTIRVRGKDMEKNMKYVADYADHNVTIAYQETQEYPYTWDFTDVTGYEANVTNMFIPEEQLGEGDTPPAGSELTPEVWQSLDDTSYQKTARDLSLWEVGSTAGDYFLRLNSQASQSLDNLMEKDNIFETAKSIGGNQVWANGTVVPEMQGLLFYTDDISQNNRDNYQRKGELTIKQGNTNNVGGLEFDGPNDFFKMVVPNVPANAAVYLRMTQVDDNPVIKYVFGEGDWSTIVDEGPDDGTGTSRFFKVKNTDYDYIVALLNTSDSKSDLTFTVDGYRVQKLAVSTDFKKVNKYGWATESRDHVIDPSLTSELSGNTFEHYIVTGASHADLTVTLTEIDEGVYMPEASEDGNQAYIIRNMNVDTDESNPQPGLVKILKVNGVWGFHLFVPDMNDYLESRPEGDYRTNQKSPQTLTNNQLLARLNGNLSHKDGDIYNYVLTTSTTSVGTGKINEYDNVVFARVPDEGMTGGKNVGYLPVDCSDGTNGANMNIVIASCGGTEDPTGIEVSFDDSFGGSNAVYYNLNGQKLNGMPTEGGIYIVNGKKVVVK